MVRSSSRVPSSVSSRETEALRLDFGRSSARAAAVKPPWSTTWQKASKSSQFIVQDSEHSGHEQPLIRVKVLPSIVPSQKRGPPGPQENPMFLKNCWYVAAWDHELIDGKLLARTLLEEAVLLYKSESGKVVALQDRCCHRGARCTWAGVKATACAACTTASSSTAPASASRSPARK